MPDKNGAPTKAEIESLVLGEPHAELAAFLREFPREIPELVKRLFRLNAELTEYATLWAETERNGSVLLFLHAAVQSLLSAAFLLIRSLPVPFGNLMRQHAEASAMAILCAEKGSGVLEHYLKDRKTYPYQKALERALQDKTAKALARTFSFDPVAWKDFIKISKFYNYHSHISVVSLGFAMRLGTPSQFVIGPDFDPEKVPMYRDDLSRLLTALVALRGLIKAIHGVAERKPKGAV